jgi:hypothetical protein
MRPFAITSPVSYETPKALMLPVAASGEAAVEAPALADAPPLAPLLSAALAGALPAAPPDDAGVCVAPLLHAVSNSDRTTRTAGAAPPRERRLGIR